MKRGKNSETVLIQRLNENFDSDCCILCLDDNCSGPIHETRHITPDYLIREVTRIGGTDAHEGLNIRFEEKSIRDIRDKEMEFQSKLVGSLEKLVKSGEDIFNLGGYFHVCYIVRPERDKVSDQSPKSYELPVTGVYHISGGKLSVRCDSSAMAFR